MRILLWKCFSKMFIIKGSVIFICEVKEIKWLVKWDIYVYENIKFVVFFDRNNNLINKKIYKSYSF